MQPRKFERAKTIEEIKALCEEKDFFIDTGKYDAGGDWVTIVFEHDGMAYQFIYSGFNGRFIGKYGNEMFSESSTEFEDLDWYNAILDFLYVPKQEPQAAE